MESRTSSAFWKLVEKRWTSPLFIYAAAKVCHFANVRTPVKTEKAPGRPPHSPALAAPSFSHSPTSPRVRRQATS